MVPKHDGSLADSWSGDHTVMITASVTSDGNEARQLRIFLQALHYHNRVFNGCSLGAVDMSLDGVLGRDNNPVTKAIERQQFWRDPWHERLQVGDSSR
jgi:hypothetical protein